MRYAKIKYFDIANGSGVRTSLFVSGCHRHCPGCFSPETWDFDFGGDFTDEVADEILKSLESPYISGLSVIGGEPLENRQDLIPFLKRVKELYPEKDIWMFTGYDWKEVNTVGEFDHTVPELLSFVDVLKVGSFMEDLSDPGLVFRGSKNQELIDLKKYRTTGNKVLWGGGL